MVQNKSLEAGINRYVLTILCIVKPEIFHTKRKNTGVFLFL